MGGSITLLGVPKQYNHQASRFSVKLLHLLQQHCIGSHNIETECWLRQGKTNAVKSSSGNALQFIQSLDHEDTCIRFKLWRIIKNKSPVIIYQSRWYRFNCLTWRHKTNYCLLTNDHVLKFRNSVTAEGYRYLTCYSYYKYYTESKTRNKY